MLVAVVVCVTIGVDVLVSGEVRLCACSNDMGESSKAESNVRKSHERSNHWAELSFISIRSVLSIHLNIQLCTHPMQTNAQISR